MTQTFGSQLSQKKKKSLESGLEDHVPDLSRIRFRKSEDSVFYIPLEMPFLSRTMPGGSKKVEGRRSARFPIAQRGARTDTPSAHRRPDSWRVAPRGGSDDDRHGLFGPESGAPRLAPRRGKQRNSRRVRFIFSAYIISSVAGAAKEGEGREVDDAARHGVRSEESGMPANRRAAAREGRRAPWRSGEILVLFGIIHGEVSPPPSPSLVSPRMVSRSPPSSH